MRSYLRKQIFDGRIKAIVYMQFIILAVVVYYNFSVTNPNVEIFYIIMGIFFLLFSIEYYILKKNLKTWLIITVGFSGLALTGFLFD